MIPGRRRERCGRGRERRGRSGVGHERRFARRAASGSGAKHMRELTRLMSYVATTKEQGILYGGPITNKADGPLVGYCDAIIEAQVRLAQLILHCAQCRQALHSSRIRSLHN